MKVKKYEITSFKQLANVVTNENIQGLSLDIFGWLNHYVYMIEKYREKYPEETKGKTNWEISQTSFIWIDDGKNDFKEVHIKNIQTGEVTTIKYDAK